MSYYSNSDEIFPVIIISLLFVLVFIVPITLGRSSSQTVQEEDVWDTVSKQADKFVYGQTNSDGSKVILFLYDENGEYLCEAVMDMAREIVDIQRGRYNTIATWYSNKEKSKKLFELLYPKIPLEVRNKYPATSEVIEKMKKLK